MNSPLQWGRRYAAVEPTAFRVEYTINPFMDTANQPDPQLALLQWHALVSTLEQLGARVEVLPQRLDAPDMVYAMNLGLALCEGDQQRLVLSHMRYPQRRMETASADEWFTRHGWTTSSFGHDGVGAHFEAGDAFAFGGSLVVGYGPRTEELALKHLATDLGVRIHGLKITHPGMYHLDLAFCPVTAETAIVCLDAFDDASARAVLELVPDPLIITEAEALTTFAANSVVVPPGTVVMPACPERLRAQLAERGLDVVLVDVTEFHKGGGSIRCLTNPLDVDLGRDLTRVPGGQVVLPR